MKRVWSLRNLPIHFRLRIFFAAVVVLMFFGSVLSFWQFRNVSFYAGRVAHAERRAAELLQLDNALLSLLSQLHRIAEDEQASRFEQEARRLLKRFTNQSANAADVLYEIEQQSDRHAVLVGGIRALLAGLPARVDSLVVLANGGDWVALHARLLNQADGTDDVMAALMGQVDSDLAGARRRLIQDLENARSRAANTLVIVGFLSLSAAVLIGTLVTRSITQPLSKLARAARALAEGDFRFRTQVEGKDELAKLMEVFNRSAADLARLFDDVQRERATAQSAQSALEAHARDLARANADLQQFAFSASHDLKEPLRIVALYSQLLQRKYAGKFDETADEYMGYLYKAARQMDQLITDLLTYTQAADARKNVDASTDADVILKKVLSTLEPQLRAQQCVVTAGSLPVVRAHDMHIQQLLQNLIGNAIKYRSGQNPEIHIWAEPQGSHWMFSVRDNGIGIEPQYAQQIFGLFKRLHGHRYPGTGIGLAICQKIVEGYGGSIWVESELGQGATFHFTLPAA